MLGKLLGHVVFWMLLLLMVTVLWPLAAFARLSDSDSVPNTRVINTALAVTCCGLQLTWLAVLIAIATWSLLA